MTGNSSGEISEEDKCATTRVQNGFVIFSFSLSDLKPLNFKKNLVG